MSFKISKCKRNVLHNDISVDQSIIFIKCRISLHSKKDFLEETETVKCKTPELEHSWRLTEQCRSYLNV